MRNIFPQNPIEQLYSFWKFLHKVRNGKNLKKMLIEYVYC